MGDPYLSERLECLGEADVSPVQGVVIGHTATVDAGSREATDVPRVHAVVNRLAWPGVVARGDGRLEVDDAQVGPLYVRQCVAPDIREVHRPWDRAIGVLGKPHV